ncbi:uncharacterized protein Dmul_19450 [Desulfococcus multivorans]|nr:uncharacterized protein Dmul_19450 [Desulfococcus multivorans]
MVSVYAPAWVRPGQGHLFLYAFQLSTFMMVNETAWGAGRILPAPAYENRK